MGRQFRRTAVVHHVVDPDQRRPAIEIEPDQHAGDRVGDVVVAAGRMVDAVAAAARRSSFQAGELRAQARMVQELDSPGVQKRQKVAIKIAFGTSALLEGDPSAGKSRPRPFARVFVPRDRRDLIAPEQSRASRHRLLRIKRRSNLQQRIEGANAAPAEVPDRQCHGVAHAARWVAKGAVDLAGLGRQFGASPTDNRVDRFFADVIGGSSRNSAPYSARAASGSLS